MKFIKLILCTLITTLITSHVIGQANPFINVLPSNSGIVSVGATIDIIVTIGNTGPLSTIPQAKLRPIIQIPTSVTFLPNAQQTGIPAGWSILTNTGSQLRVCNSTDPIPVSTSRIIILKAQGVTVTPPQTFSGNINFGNGTTCTAGTSIAGDLTTDNSALSTIEVIPGAALPVILNNFFAKSDHCIAYLNWSTSSETNSEKFEIEKSEVDPVKWNTIGSVKAQGHSSTSSSYSFQDDLNISNNKVIMYRLKMIDVDGSFTYSQVVSVLFNCDEQNLSVFPNPVTNGIFNISIHTVEDIEADLSSVTGQRIKKIILKNGMNNMDVTELSNGVYILSTQFENGITQNVKVNIQK